MKFGYARVSTKTQKHDLQVYAFLKEGISSKNIYANISSGAKSERKGLDEMLAKLREGDTVVVWKLDRIARSLSHLVKLIDFILVSFQAFLSIFSSQALLFLEDRRMHACGCDVPSDITHE